MIGVFLWLCCMIVEEYKLGCWMVECIWLKCVPCSVWWTPKMAQMSWKMDFDGLIGCEMLEIFFNRSWIPFHGSLAKYLQLLWWCLFVDWSCLKNFEMQKVHFQLSCLWTNFNFAFFIPLNNQKPIFWIWSWKLWMRLVVIYKWISGCTWWKIKRFVNKFESPQRQIFWRYVCLCFIGLHLFTITPIICTFQVWPVVLLSDIHFTCHELGPSEEFSKILH